MPYSVTLAPNFPSFCPSLLLFQDAPSNVCGDEIILFLPSIVRKTQSSDQSCFGFIFLLILSCSHSFTCLLLCFIFPLFNCTSKLSLLIYTECCCFNSMSSAFPVFAIILHPAFTVGQKRHCDSSDKDLDLCSILASLLETQF